MYREMLYVQWRWSRDLLAFFTVAGFAIPLLVFWFAMPYFGDPSAPDLVTGGQLVGGFCLGLALLAGGALAAQGYGMDDRVGHVHALSLPVTRFRFLTTRAFSAFVLLALPAIAIWIGAALTAAQVATPPSIRAYPGALAVRALLAAWLAHSCVFALRYSAGRRAKTVFFVLLIVWAVTATSSLLIPASRAILSHAGNFLVSHPGPFGIIFGGWTLFDV